MEHGAWGMVQRNASGSCALASTPRVWHGVCNIFGCYPGILARFLQLDSRSRLRRASVDLSVTIYLGVMS